MTVKETMIKIIHEQPDDSSFNEILKELALREMIEQGIKDSEAGRTVPHSKAKEIIESWKR